MNIFFQKHAENETRRLVLDLLFLFLRNRLNLEVKATGLFFLTAIWLPLANFGTLSRRQPHSPNVNHCVLPIRPKGHQEPCSRVRSLSLAKCPAGFEPGTFQF